MTNHKDINGFKNPVAYKVGGVYSGLFLYIGMALPFWALWLAKMGLSPAEIGILMGLPSFLKILSSPFIAQFCDKWGTVRRPMMWLLILSVLFFMGYFISRSFVHFVLVTVFFSFTYFSVAPLMESYAVRACDKYNLQYGRLRSVGSFTFVITSILFGEYLDYYGYDNFLYFGVASIMYTFFTVYLLPREGRKSVPTRGNKSLAEIAPLKFLLTNRQFIMFLLVLSLLQMSHGFVYVLGSYHWATQGIDNKTIGLLWSIGVGAEILIFIFGGKIVTRIRPMYFLIFIAMFGAIRWGVMGATTSLPLLILAQTLHGLTYGASHLVAMYYLSSRVPSKYFMTAQSLYSSVPMGMAIGLVMLFSGPIYNIFGGQTYYFMSALCLIALMVARQVRRIEDA